MRLSDRDSAFFSETIDTLKRLGVKDEQEAIVILQKEVDEYRQRIEAYQEYINDHQSEWKTVTKTAEDNETTVTIRSKRQITSIGVYFADETEGGF